MQLIKLYIIYQLSFTLPTVLFFHLIVQLKNNYNSEFFFAQFGKDEIFYEKFYVKLIPASF